ncbi:hypothetical protein C8R48DRAFT_600293 [Suillus tomentosus]|nr:hypothetical protein C8R48DRAFT_600293 [Suillus tomentosus]
MTTTSSLPITLAQAIAYLTRPLLLTYPVATIIRLQLALEANLTALFAPSWVPKEPLRGSGRRCLTFSPNCLPPRAVYAACLASSVQWFDWIAVLGGQEFDFFVDPGCISVRFGKGTELITVWSEELMAQTVFVPPHTHSSQLSSKSKTFAQQLLENDHTDDDELFALIADEVSAPTWMTPITDRFPSSQLSRRERARQARVFIDTSKTEVTPYDGGKTTVLTGGVMLGAPPKSKSGTSVPAWRRV